MANTFTEFNLTDGQEADRGKRNRIQHRHRNKHRHSRSDPNQGQ